MTLESYEHYAAAGTKTADERWGPRMKFFVIVAAVVCGLVGVAVAKAVGLLAGLVVGALVGYGIYRLAFYLGARSATDELYRDAWCAERAMTYKGDDYFPADAPYAKSGDRRTASDAFEGEWNGLTTLFYNFTYTEVDYSDEHNKSTDYDFKIMRLTGRELPIARLTIHQRGALNRFKWVDNLQGALTKERSVSLESADFNEKFDLTIDDDADDVWIRRIFDPATIQGLVDGSLKVPDLRYYNNAWWFVEKGHFKIRDLEQWVERQKNAADGVALLSRVQEL